MDLIKGDSLHRDLEEFYCTQSLGDLKIHESDSASVLPMGISGIVMMIKKDISINMAPIQNTLLNPATIEVRIASTV